MFFIYPASDTGKQMAKENKDAVQKEELKIERGRTNCGGRITETKHPPPGEDEAPGSECLSSTVQVQQDASACQHFSAAAALIKALSVLERPPALTETLEKSPLTSISQKKSPSTATTLPKTLEELVVSPPPQDKTSSTISATSSSPEEPQLSPLSHKVKGSGAGDPRNSMQERREMVTEQHTTKAEPSHQRTEPPLSK